MIRTPITVSLLLGVFALGGISLAGASEATPPEPPVAAQSSTEEMAATVVIEEASAQEADAEIRSLSGPETRANRGEGYVPATDGMLLNAGDSLFAGPDSQIVIYYFEEKCTVVVEPETYARVEEDPSCRKAGALPFVIGGVALAGGLAIILLNDDDDDNDRPVSPF